MRHDKRSIQTHKLKGQIYCLKMSVYNISFIICGISKPVWEVSVLSTCEYFNSCNVEKERITFIPRICFRGKERWRKTSRTCHVMWPPARIRMHNHNVVKDEIHSWNYFQLDSVTEHDPSAGSLPESWQESWPCPEAKVNLATRRHHRLSAPAAMFNSSHTRPSARVPTGVHTRKGKHQKYPIFHWLNFIQFATVTEKIK